MPQVRQLAPCKVANNRKTERHSNRLWSFVTLFRINQLIKQFHTWGLSLNSSSQVSHKTVSIQVIQFQLLGRQITLLGLITFCYTSWAVQRWSRYEILIFAGSRMAALTTPLNCKGRRKSIYFSVLIVTIDREQKASCRLEKSAPPKTSMHSHFSALPKPPSAANFEVWGFKIKHWHLTYFP